MRTRSCWVRRTARWSGWSGDELRGGPRLDERADQLLDHADVLGVVGIDLEALDIVEGCGDREACVPLAQREVTADGHGLDLGERRSERVDGRGDRLDL